MGKAITAKLKTYVNVIYGIEQKLSELKRLSEQKTIRIGRKKFDTASLDALISRVREFIHRYGQEDSVADEYMIPTLNGIMNDYRTLTEHFSITEEGIQPKGKTSIK